MLEQEAKLTSSPKPDPRARGWVAALALVLAVAAVAGVVFVAVTGYNRMQSLEAQLARRIGEFDVASKDARAAAKAANDALADLQNRLAALETRAQETQTQQVALSAMYQDLAKSSDERVLADVEQTLFLAQQQLQVAGNVKAAVIGLEAADARLTRLDKPQFAPLHKAIVQDMEHLKLMPAADIDGMNAKLEALIQAVGGLKTESDSEPTAAPAPPPSNATLGTMEAFGRDVWNEVKGLLRIRRLDHPELPLLTPSQHYFLRQNLTLRLLSARVAMLQRDEATFRADLQAAQAWVEHYFNRRDPGTQAFLASLAELLQAPVALQDAQIDASLKAVQAAQATRGNGE